MNRTNEEKLELLADVIEPFGAIIVDKAWAQKWQEGDKYGAIKVAIKGHKREIIEILARIDGVEPEEYTLDGMVLFVRLVNMFNRPDLEMVNGLFMLHAQNAVEESSGRVTENTGGGAK